MMKFLVQQVVLMMMFLSATGGVRVINRSWAFVTTSGINQDLACNLSGPKSPQETIEWRKYNYGERNYRTLYSSSRGLLADAGKYHVTALDKAYTLRIKNIEWKDGALYRCVVKSGDLVTDENYGGDLGVFDEISLEVPETIVEDIPVDITCEFGFGASSKFDLTFLMTINEGRLFSFDQQLRPRITTQTGSKPNKISAVYRFTADDDHDGKEMKCKAHYKGTRVFIIAKSELDVEWKPEHIKFEPMQGLYGLDQTIECKAEAKPDAEYQWQSDVSPKGVGLKIEGANLKITEEMMEGNKSTHNAWTCKATNEHGSASLKHEFHVSFHGSGPSHMMAPLLLIFIFMVITLF